VKLKPVLALLLVHDQLLSKNGIAAPATHALKAAVLRHKTRLNGEFVKARLKHGYHSLEALKEAVNSSSQTTEDGDGEGATVSNHVRWMRVNTLRRSREDVFQSSFKDFTEVDTIDKLRIKGAQKIYYEDSHIPNLFAFPAKTDLTRTSAYRDGEVILQDKASCFPAYLLDPQPEDRDIIDATAAPGNKTTHLSALAPTNTVHAFERDKVRSVVLTKMVTIAGADDKVIIHAGQDFLREKPNDEQWANVGALLLDPSCSGSGIVGRDDGMPIVRLPSTTSTQPAPSRRSKKRKRGPGATEPSATTAIKEPDAVIEEETQSEDTPDEKLQERLTKLSNFQLLIILHAFAFPSARKVTYSTCSVHATENEQVVIRALASPVAKERGWGVLKRSDQVSGMREWQRRGLLSECDDDTDIADACIRCEKGGKEGTMGFFVVGFVRDDVTIRDSKHIDVAEIDGEDDGEDYDADEWGGISD
jgi:25S rRNA (cytosine2278-C5)-methyltransferase